MRFNKSKSNLPTPGPSKCQARSLSLGLYSQPKGTLKHTHTCFLGDLDSVPETHMAAHNCTVSSLLRVPGMHMVGTCRQNIHTYKEKLKSCSNFTSDTV